MFDTPRDLVRLALEMLPAMPASIEVFSEDGGSFMLTLADHEDALIYAYGDRNHVREGLTLEHRMRNGEGDGHDIRFLIKTTFFQSGSDLLLHLHVSGIEEHYASRGAPRASLNPQATARILYARELDRDEVIEVRIVDASTTGIGFITDRRFHPGDVIEVIAPLPDRPVRLEARVVASAPVVYGRNRVGCEITAILEADRHSIGLLATLSEQAGSEDDRRPEILDTLERARHRQTLGARRSPRY